MSFRSQLLPGFCRALFHLAVGMTFASNAGAQSPDPGQGPGGPVLVITSGSTYGKYYAEILRTEGLNAFAVTSLGSVTSAVLSQYDVAILTPTTLTPAQVTMLTDWVTAGGRLIAMRPDAALGTLLGIAATGSTLTDAYLAVDTSTPAGNGIFARPMQFHGVADRLTLSGAAAIATLYSNATTATSNPAVTIRTAGTNGGQAAAFAFDLATSVVYTRQGNPAWAAQERDGLAPIRPDDKFYGPAATDPKPDWVDLSTLVAVPQADEQQRLLANLILTMNIGRKPLPRFWYFPNGKPAVVLMTGDDHGNGGTVGRFNQQLAASPSGCNLDNWECIRSTSYMFVQPQNVTAAQAASFSSQGFEVGLHINTDCGDFTPASLSTYYTQQIGAFRSAYPTTPAPITERHHCIVWSDWVTGAKTQLSNGIRLDTSYYFWPPDWVQDRPGHFTGSAMPMRFADLDGTIIDVYNAVTQMTDESGQTYPQTSDALLSAAVGPEGFYGVYTVNAHTDSATNPVADAVLSSAVSRGIPVVSSAQMLKWLDGRNGSSFSALSWTGSALTFTIARDARATGLQAMLPASANGKMLSALSGPSGAVSWSVQTIKGIAYAIFPASAGGYTATYAADTTPPVVSSTIPSTGASGVAQNATVRATFSEAIDVTSLTSTTFVLRNAANATIPASVTYDAGARTAILTPVQLDAGTTFTATLTTGIRDIAGNALAASYSWSFSTTAAPTCPCSAWPSSAAPATSSVTDPNPVELGVRFRVDVNGFITGIRFYKGSANTGPHTGSLWTTGGQLLASAPFANETPSGWQQVNFQNPVPVTANTVYVASYFTSSGNYAFTDGQFASAGISNPPVYLLQDGVSGANGVYAYGASSQFPSSSYHSANYWVDVVFNTSTSGGTQLSVNSTSPASGATGVSATANVSATFSSTLNASTVNSSTFTLTGPGNTPVTGIYSVSGSTATLVPGAALAAAATYTATLTTGVADSSGHNLATNYTWTFTTGGSVSSGGPEPAGWFSGDIHVHRSCGGTAEALTSILSRMDPNNLAVISLLADSGNGEVQNPVTDLPKVNGQDDPISTASRIVHWDTEWHWDATYSQYAHQALGGHILSLGLTQAQQLWYEYTYPILNNARQQGGIAGFAHMQYLDGNFPQSLTCCTPVEYPVEVALGAADFISEDVASSGSGVSNMYPDKAIEAYYKLLNTGFRPGYAAGTDYPCNGGRDLGSLLTYVRVANGQMTYRNWIDGIAKGRTVVSRNGHNEFLDLKVNGSATPGDEIQLAAGGSLPVTVQWTATQSFSGSIQIVSNGTVVATQQASVTAGTPYTWSGTVSFPKSGWVAARRMGSDGHQVHTGAVFVIVNNAPIRASSADARYFVQWMNSLLTNTSPGGPWNHYFPTSLAAAQARYQSARTIFQQIASDAAGPLTSISVTPANASISVGGTRQYTATGTYADASTQDITSQVAWTSSKPAVATVNTTGLATGVAGGSATISAALSGITGSTTLTVAAAPLSVTTSSLPGGTTNTAYSASLTATGGVSPYSWSMASGTLPAGLTLNANGTIGGTPTAAGTSNFTVRVTDSATPATTATRALSITIQSAIVTTSYAAPTANAPVAGAGDGNGFETTPTNGYTLNGLFAVDANSGTNTNTSCTNAGKDKHDYFTYGISVPSGSTVLGLEVRLNGLVDSTTGAPQFCVQLSWNNGLSWTAAKSTTTLSTTNSAYLLGGASDTWGRSWTPQNLANGSLRVRIISVAASTSRRFSLDAVAVRVTYR